MEARPKKSTYWKPALAYQFKITQPRCKYLKGESAFAQQPIPRLACEMNPASVNFIKHFHLQKSELNNELAVTIL